MNEKYIYLLVLIAGMLLVFSLSSCKKNYCNDIIRYAKAEFGSNINQKQINLQQVYNFDWETLYIFHPWQHPDEISKAIGFDCNCNIVPEGKWLYLFIKQDRIIEQNTIECLNFTFEGLHNGKGVLKITYSDSEFTINSDDGYYVLK